MPVIQNYTQSVLPEGGIRTQADASAFGAPMGAAISGMGQTAAEVADRLADRLTKVEDDQGRIWAYDASQKKYSSLRQTLRQQVNSLNPDDPDFTAKSGALVQDFQTEVDNATQELIASAPSRSARRIVESHMAVNARGLINQAMDEQARVAGEYTAKLVNDSTKSDQDSIAGDPSNENAERIVATGRENIGALQTVDPVSKMKWIDSREHSLAITQIQSLLARDPKGFLAAVNPVGGGKLAVPTTAPSAEAVNPGLSMEDVFSHVIWAESRGRQFDKNGQPLVSKAGAIGKAQIMPGTGPAAAAAAGVPFDMDRLKNDPAYNAKLGQALFASYLKGYSGDLQKALAAYNWGSGALDEAVSKYGANWMQHAPAETKNFIATISARVEANARIANTNVVPPVAPQSLPQVQPMNEQDVANASPAIWGWSKLTWPEKVAMVRQAESALGSSLASERADIQAALKDIKVAAANGQIDPRAATDRFGLPNLQRVFGAEQGQRLYNDKVYSLKVGRFVAQMDKMPVGQAEAGLQAMMPKPGEGYADRYPVFAQAFEALQRVQTARIKDFGQWAINSGKAQPMDFSSPDTFKAGLQARIPVALSGVNDYRVGGDSHLLSKGEVEQLGNIISKAAPQDQIAYIRAIREATKGSDNWFRDVLGQVAAKNTMLPFAADLSTKGGRVTTDAGPQDSSMVAKYVLEGAHILQGKDIDDPTHVGRPMRIDDKMFRQYFWATVGPNAFSGPDAQRSAQVANDTYQAAKNYLAADIYHRRGNVDYLTPAMVKNAVNAVTGGTVKVPSGDRLFLPWGMDPKTFSERFSAGIREAVRDAGLEGTDLDNPDRFHYSNWSDGRYLVRNAGGQVLYGKDGRPVVIEVK